MKRRSPRSLLFPAVLAAAFAVAGRAAADPAVIRDNRLTDLAVTPSLGRGYAPGPNAMYSVCFDVMPTTQASFDFDFAFEELSLDQRTLSTVSGRFRGSEVSEFLRANTRERSVQRKQTRHHVHYLLATLIVDSYYSSIDEGRSKLAEGAAALLQGGDALGFFTSCGTHYVRSIGRRSHFLTLFSYVSTDRRRDSAFERQLQQSVQRLDPDGVESAGERTDSAKFSEEAKSRDLKIVSKSIGLVSQKSAHLIPFDLASYKAAVKAAFKASQSEFTGRVTAIEVTPWLANPVVLAALERGAPAAATPATSRFQRKQILGDNAEFYLALVARMKEVELLVHKAGLCRQELDLHILVDGAIPAALSSAQVVNHRTGERRPLRALVDALSPDNLQRLADVEREYTEGESGAGACVAQLEQSGLTSVPHEKIPACAKIASPVAPGASVIEDYCLPQLADRP